LKPLDRSTQWWLDNWGKVSADDLWPPYLNVRQWVEQGGMNDSIVALIDMMLEEEFYPVFVAVNIELYDPVQVSWHIATLLGQPVSIEQKYHRIGYLIQLWSDPIKLHYLFLNLGEQLDKYRKARLNFVPPTLPPDLSPLSMDKEERDRWIPESMITRAWEYATFCDPDYQLVLEACEQTDRFLMYPHVKRGIDRNKALAYIQFLSKTTMSNQTLTEVTIYLLHIWYKPEELKRIADMFRPTKEITIH
jgi:hypothetical protein